MCAIILLLCARAQAHTSQRTLLDTKILLQKIKHNYLFWQGITQFVCLEQAATFKNVWKIHFQINHLENDDS